MVKSECDDEESAVEDSVSEVEVDSELVAASEEEEGEQGQGFDADLEPLPVDNGTRPVLSGVE